MSATGARAAGAGTRNDGATDGNKRTPAQWYCLLAGAALLLAGIAGFFVNSNFDTGLPLDGDQLLLFEVNGWHNVVHVLSGIVLLGASTKRHYAKTTAIVFGLTYGAVAVWGLIEKTNVAQAVTVNPADNVLHIALSVAGVVSGLVSSGKEHEVERTA